jgi:hypothetical protein
VLSIPESGPTEAELVAQAMNVSGKAAIERKATALMVSSSRQRQHKPTSKR